MRLLDKFKKKGFESENVKPENSEEIIVDRFPFADAPNTACFTCRHVLEEHKPNLYVSHDEDGYWQFLCGGSHKEEDARVVSLASILNIDETMGDLAGLDYGECAEAEDAASDWMVKCTLSEGMK